MAAGRKLAKGRPDSSLFFWLAIQRYDLRTSSAVGIR